MLLKNEKLQTRILFLMQTRISLQKSESLWARRERLGREKKEEAIFLISLLQKYHQEWLADKKTATTTLFWYSKNILSYSNILAADSISCSKNIRLVGVKAKDGEWVSEEKNTNKIK